MNRFSPIECWNNSTLNRMSNVRTDAVTPIERRPSGRKILFASAHSILDFSNGASVATLDLLQALTNLGLECQAFCTAKLDLNEAVCFEKLVGDLHEPFQVRPSACGDSHAKILYTRRHQVPITLIRLDSTRHIQQGPEEVGTILQFFQSFLEVYRPDVLLTYGGDPVTQGMMALARRRGTSVVFGLHNFQYVDPRAFSQVDYCIVPSEFTRRHYQDKLGLDCQVLPHPLDWDRVRVTRRDPRFVTFVNPAPYKGRTRLCGSPRSWAVAGPISRFWWSRAGGPGTARRLRAHDRRSSRYPGHADHDRSAAVLESHQDPSDALALVGNAGAGRGRGHDQRHSGRRLRSRRIPETLAQAGIALPLPERLTPVSRILPTAEEMEPWVEAIIRLWDDPAWYQEQSIKATNQGQLWHPDRLRPLYAEFFQNVQQQPRPPMMAAASEPVPAGRPIPAPNGTGRRATNSNVPPLSFVVCVSDNAILKANLQRSPCLAGPGSPHEVLAIHDAPTAGLRSTWPSPRPGTNGSLACIRMCSCQMVGTDALLSSSRRPSDGLGRSVLLECMVSVR